MSEAFVEVDGEEVRISSPERVVFPDRGWTKMDVVEHFLGCIDGAHRAVTGRPTMLKRYMKNVDVPPIYHKRAAKGTPFETVMIRFPSQRPGRMNVPNSKADVIRLVQLGCLDLHPWPVRAADIDHPDEMRIDLDPTPGFGFEHIREAAGYVRDLLDEVGLVGWPKTSGSKGIHVYVRLVPEYDFIAVRRALLAFARELERRHELLTTAWWKEERTGIFIDFNQMARDKTISAAYGVRPTGYVSAPFRWDELADVCVERFPMDRFVADRYSDVGDLTDGIDEAAGRLDTLLEWVVRDEEEFGQGDAPWPPHYPKQPGEPPRVAPSRMRKENWDNTESD